MKATFDSNILIDALNGHERALVLLKNTATPSISTIVYAEVLAGFTKPRDIEFMKSGLRRFSIIDVDVVIAELSSEYRKKYRLKLPDAIILATAGHLKIPLYTRNTKDFKASMPNIVIPYTIH